MTNNNKYKVLDLFCGCGGLSKGFEMAGYDILLGVDFNEPALKTFAYNHHGSKTLCGDLSAPETFGIIDHILDGKKIDVIIGGPPCQGFSLTGPRKFDDERNKLDLAMIESVRRFKPKAFLIENVPGMATLYKGEVRNEIIKRFTEMGYNVNSKILCSADYGVPQIRKRLIFVGVLESNETFVFPEPYLKPEEYITCEQAIGDLPSLEHTLGDDVSEYEMDPITEYQKLMRGSCNVLYNHNIHQSQFISLLYF